MSEPGLRRPRIGNGRHLFYDAAGTAAYRAREIRAASMKSETIVVALGLGRWKPFDGPRS